MNDVPVKKATYANLMLYVVAGVAALTEYFGDQSWVDKIDLSEFDFQDMDFCVAGQLFGNPWENYNRLGLAKNQWLDICAKAAFELPDEFREPGRGHCKHNDQTSRNWDMLERCWKKTLKHLKANRVKVNTVVVTDVEVAVSCKREPSFA